MHQPSNYHWGLLWPDGPSSNSRRVAVFRELVESNKEGRHKQVG